MKVLALDVGGTAIKSALFEQERILVKTELPSDGGLGKKALLERIRQSVSCYKAFDAIGISTAGQVDSRTGIITGASDNIPDYTGTNLKEIFEEAYQVPVFVENDVNAAALGELHYGCGRDEPDFLCLTFGTGIGGAIVINREVYKGAFGAAGEIGHIMTHPGGEACTCGLKGCYEQYASASAFIRQVSSRFPELTDGKKIMEAMKRESENDCLQRLTDGWISEIAYGLATLVHIFNPSLMILGGGIFSEPYLLPIIRQKLKENIIESFRPVRLKTAELGNLAGLYGVLAVCRSEMKL